MFIYKIYLSFLSCTYLCHFTTTSHRPISHANPNTLIEMNSNIYLLLKLETMLQGSRFDALLKILDICLG